mgnify:CR=1 FL=1
MMSYDNSISVSVLRYLRYQCFDIGFRSHFGGNYHVKTVRKSWTQGLRLFDRSIYIALTFEFGHYTSLLKKAIFDKVYNIEIEPALVCTVDLDQA